MIEVYTDGSCLHNPGPGGWAAKCYDPEFVVEGGFHTTTNNIMEMTAVIKALEKCLEIGENDVILYTDSKYVKLGVTEWSKKWMANGWKTSTGTDVANKTLWVRIFELVKHMNTLTIEWVRAHSTNEKNNEVDRLARCQAHIFSELNNEHPPLV
jgi:ribonuclease HI